MSEKRCIICDSTKVHRYINSEDVRAPTDILRCGQCGLVFFRKNEKPKLDNSYWSSKSQQNLYEEKTIVQGFEKEFQERLRCIDKIKERGKLLDIGCGMGYFLQQAKNDGWQTFGIEISHSAAVHAQKNFSIEVFNGTVENSQLANESLDVVTMWDVIEHIQNPIEALESIKNKLKQTGLLVIKTPNEDSLFRLVSKFFYFISGKKLKFLLKYVYYVPHYFYYNKNSIKKLLEKFNLKILKVDSETTNYNFAKEKIKLHYNKFFSKNLILLLLPLIYFLSKVLRMQNKMIVYAIKL